MKPIAEKYKVNAIYLFGSYARGEADENSDLDFLVCGGENFKLTLIFSLAEELREILRKNQLYWKTGLAERDVKAIGKDERQDKERKYNL